ncbi:MAG: tRNA (adenosine(37)-N6)-dimethylallyltransferase MiaA [Putridiphycobacter sp.]|nr:tRNA (adenosine(37)-N6)-dimethylallyltransferase MiaA [Putridiphycobacter sp.]
MLSVQSKIKANYNPNKYLVIIVGPTAIGKTALSIDIANFYDAPILSFDSRQFFKEMNIGTAKPSNEELASADHYFIDSHSINTEYTAGKFETESLEQLASLFTKNDICVAVGGSGLYIDALVFGIDAMPSSRDIRNKWIAIKAEKGIHPLQQFLDKHNPEVFEFIDRQNHARMIRAIEVIECSGQKFTDFRKKSAKSRPFTPIWIGLDMNRSDLYDRINARVDRMIEKGLEEEVTSLVAHRHHTALKTVGYAEFFDFFDGNISREKAIELIKRNSRRYAKRQMTWFGKNESIKWFSPESKGDILAYIQHKTGK